MQEKNEAMAVNASYNHSMALSKTGKVYSWGFSGKGTLGRIRKIDEHLPLEIGFKSNEFQGRVPLNYDFSSKTDSKQDQVVSFEVSKVVVRQLPLNLYNIVWLAKLSHPNKWWRSVCHWK